LDQVVDYVIAADTPLAPSSTPSVL